MIIYNMPMDEYHADTAISNSKIKVFADHGPARFYRQFIARDLPGDDSPAFAFGRAFDDHVFDPEGFSRKYARKPEGLSLATKEGKEWKSANEGKEIISDADWQIMGDMLAAINANQFAVDLLSIGSPQVTIRREVPDLGIVVQSRPDWLSLSPFLGLTEGPYLVDLKTTSDLDAFDRNAIAFGYGRQLAMAQYLLAQEGYICDAFLLVVEKKRAGRCRVRRLPEVALAAGFAQFRRYGAEIGRRLAANDWTDRQMAIEECKLTSWQEKELTEEARI
jgi:hypothetical protein